MALSTQIDTQQAFVSFDMDPDDRVTLGEYVQNYPLNYISPELWEWVGLPLVRGLGWLHNKRILHGGMKTSKLFVFRGRLEQVIKIGISALRCAWMRSWWIEPDTSSDASPPTTIPPPPEMLLARIPKLPHIELAADISLGVVLLELCGTQHTLHPFQSRGLQDRHDARPHNRVPYNSRWPIREDLQEVLNICLGYESAKRRTVQALFQHNGQASGK